MLQNFQLLISFKYHVSHYEYFGTFFIVELMIRITFIIKYLMFVSTSVYRKLISSNDARRR